METTCHWQLTDPNHYQTVGIFVRMWDGQMSHLAN